jgi:hypothetical protein
MSKKVLMMLMILSCPAFAQGLLVQKASVDKSPIDGSKFSVEVYYDKTAKRADLWFDYQQDSGEKKVAFKATTIPERLKEATHKLVAQPVSKLDGTTVLIFNAFATKEGHYYDGDKGLALLVHYPAEQLPPVVFDAFEKDYPRSLLKDALSGEFKFVKMILNRITLAQVYPLVAFDMELDLGG